MTRVEWYLGDERYNEAWFEDTKINMNWITHYIKNTETNLHPSAKLVVTTFVSTTEEVYTPTDPLPLQEVLG